jgi:choline kinase
MQQAVLVILAAGLGARFGGFKQLKGIGPNEEIIMDYSIYDALSVGFEEIILVVQECMIPDLKKKYCEDLNLPISFCVQTQEIVVQNQKINREKPWGTGHALLAAKNSISSSFCTINADDFYGRNSFQLAFDYLSHQQKNCAIVFPLIKTLSDNGTVNRAEIITDNGHLKSTIERENIFVSNNTVYHDLKKDDSLRLDSNVSMNMWGFTPAIFDFLEAEFAHSMIDLKNNSALEFQLPTAVNSIIAKHALEILVIPSDENWFGITYQADLKSIKENILTKNYPSPLWKS